jgi:hypothetical protein
MARSLSIPVNIGKHAFQAQEGWENHNILGACFGLLKVVIANHSNPKTGMD